MTIEISDHYGAHIDGEQYEGNDSFTVSDPAIDEPIAAVTETGPEGADVAMAVVGEVLADRRDIDPAERGYVLRKIADA